MQTNYNVVVEEAIKKPNKIKEYFAKHENLRQIVVYLLISFLAAAAEFGSYYLFKFLLVDVGKITQDANWFVFQDYSSAQGGLGLLLAFLISNTIAQIIAFVLNRKKTFHANNNLAFAISAYVVMVVAIIIANAALNGVVFTAIHKKMEPNKYADFVAGTVSKAVGSVLGSVITFLSMKFVIMRRKNTKEESIDNLDQV